MFTASTCDDESVNKREEETKVKGHESDRTSTKSLWKRPRWGERKTHEGDREGRTECHPHPHTSLLDLGP